MFWSTPLLRRDMGSMEKTPSLALQTHRFWQNGMSIDVSFLHRNGTPSTVIEEVKKVANEWTKYANLRFSFVDHDRGLIRVAFRRGHGHYSFVGNDCLSVSLDKPTMNLDPEEINTASLERNYRRFRQIVLHEFGHAVGCIHEHSHPNSSINWDKQYVYDFYKKPPYRWSKEKVDLNIFARYHFTQVTSSEVDKSSIMMYQFGSEFTTDKKPISGGDDLSPRDRLFISLCYPFPAIVKAGTTQYEYNKQEDPTTIPFTAMFADSTLPSSLLLGISYLDIRGPNLSFDLRTSLREADHLGVHVSSLHRALEDPPEHSKPTFSWLAPMFFRPDLQHGMTTVTFTGDGGFGLPNVKAIPITFQNPYPSDEVPRVTAWIHSLKSRGSSGHSFQVLTSNIHSHGFTLVCITAPGYNCEMGVTWFAYAVKRLEIYSSSVMVETPNGQNDQWQSIITHELCNRLSPGTIHVFAAFSELTVSGDALCVSLTLTKCTSASMTWCIRTWGNTRLDTAMVTFIACVHEDGASPNVSDTSRAAGSNGWFSHLRSILRGS